MSWLKDSLIRIFRNTYGTGKKGCWKKLPATVKLYYLYESCYMVPFWCLHSTFTQTDRQMCDIKKKRWGEWSCKIMPDTDMTLGVFTLGRFGSIKTKSGAIAQVMRFRWEGCYPNPGMHQTSSTSRYTSIWTLVLFDWNMNAKWTKDI